MTLRRVGDYNNAMCYSAMVEEDLKKLERLGVNDVEGFREYFRLQQMLGIQNARGLDANFDHPSNDWQREIKGLIDARRAAQETKWQTELFKQSKRLTDAERALATKPTKK